MVQSTLISAFSSTLAPRGFRKRFLTWRRFKADSVLVVNLQRSRWSESYFVNLGVYYFALGSEKEPPPHRCHYQDRLCSIHPDRSALLGALGFEGQPHSAESTIGIVSRALLDTAIPWLENRSSLQGAKSVLEVGDPGAAVSLALRQHLGLPLP
jgi:hypothetical protein